MLHSRAKEYSTLMHTVDALVESTEEGRTRQRNAAGSCHEALIRRCPNGVIPLNWDPDLSGRERVELKHLSKRRKREQKFIPPVVASEKGTV